jgi:hypothetical protein
VVLLGDEAQVGARFGFFGVSANPDTRQVHGLRRTWVMWNLISIRLEIVLISVQDRCTVCAKRTIGLEIVLDAPNGNPR